MLPNSTLRPEHLRIIGESLIANARPPGVGMATLCSVLAGLVVIMMSTPFLLTGLFVGDPVWWIGEGVVGAGLVCIVPAWGLYRGYLWAWCAEVLLAVLFVALAWWWMIGAGYRLGPLSTTLIILHLMVQFMLWKPRTRRWFCQSHRLRSHGYEGVEVAYKEAS